MLPTDAEKELALMYQDDAKKILNMWDVFQKELADYDNAVKKLEKFDYDEYESAVQAYADIENCESVEDAAQVFEDYAKAQSELAEASQAAEIAVIYDYLGTIEYGEGTLLDFFMRPVEEVEEDITSIYPLVASLTDGQKAGIEFINFRELFAIALTDESTYCKMTGDVSDPVSIYEGVDRGIYQKGGVALTSDALRSEALIQQEDPGSLLSPLSWIFVVITGISASAMTITLLANVTVKVRNYLRISSLTNWVNDVPNARLVVKDFPGLSDHLYKGGTYQQYLDSFKKTAAAQSRYFNYLSAGLTFATVIIALITTYLAYRDMVNYYKVDFTPIPHYMVDEADITVFNERGEKEVIKNQAAYYKAVRCNRGPADEFYGTLGNCADMNGDVGRQWLALYAQTSDVAAPILADSLIVKVNDTNLPAGYTTGIHMFGSGSAFNLNSELYDWNKDAPSVMVYFKTETASAASTSGSNFTAGNLALAGGAGLAFGALVSAIAVTAADKKKSKKAAA